MKKKRLFIIILLLFFCFPLFSPLVPSAIASDDISVYFTDPNFQKAVTDWLGIPEGSSFTKQDLIDRMPVKSYTLILFKKDVKNLTGLQYFEGLEAVNCTGNQLTELPVLPASLKQLNCSYNQIALLPALPEGLESLDCTYNILTKLPVLPASLKHLSCYDNQLTKLPALPASLKEIRCDNNHLIELPVLPLGLKELSCDYNRLTELPALPMSLEVVTCTDNYLTKLPALPTNLTYFNCRSNYLNIWAEPLKSQLVLAGGMDQDRQYRIFALTYPSSYASFSENEVINFPIKEIFQAQRAHFVRYYSWDGVNWYDDINVSEDIILSISNPDVAIMVIDNDRDLSIVEAFDIGTCTITGMYKGIDAEFTKAVISVTVQNQNTSPEIALLGDNPVNICQGDTFVDPGATATDAEDGDLTSNIIVTGTVDTTVVGTYTITYTVTDSGGLTATKTRTVIVNAVPVLGLNITPNRINLTVGDTQQATATLKYADETTEDVTNSTAWSIDPSIATVTYTGLLKGISAGESILEGIYSRWEDAELITYSDAALVIVTEPEPTPEPEPVEEDSADEPEEPVNPEEPIEDPVTPPVDPIDEPEEPVIDDPQVEEPEPTKPTPGSSKPSKGLEQQKPMVNEIIKDGDNKKIVITDKPSTNLEDLNGKFVARLENSKTITDAIAVVELAEENIIPIDTGKIPEFENGRELRAYYWNPAKQKWVALASYVTNNTVEFTGDIKEGYVAVFAVNQPIFTDLEPKTDIENIINRLNGLAIIEGYPGEEKIRTFKASQPITGAEFAAIQARIVGMVEPGQQRMYEILPLYKRVGDTDWFDPYIQNLKELIEIPEKIPEVVTKEEAIASIDKLQKFIETKSDDKFTGQLNIPKNNIVTRAEASKLILSFIEGLGW